MGFYDHEELTPSFDANAMVNLRSKEAGMTAEKLLRTYISGYEKFWQTPRTHGERALGMADLNAMLAAAPAIMTEIQADGTAFVAFVQSTYPEKVGTDLFPTRYLTIPYESDENGLLTTLKPEWDVQEEEEEV